MVHSSDQSICEDILEVFVEMYYMVHVFVRVFWRYLWSWRYYMVQSSGAPPSLWSMTANSQGQPGSPMMQHWLLWHLRKVQKFTKYKIQMQTFTANLTFKESSDAITSQCKPHMLLFSHFESLLLLSRSLCLSVLHLWGWKPANKVGNYPPRKTNDPWSWFPLHFFRRCWLCCPTQRSLPEERANRERAEQGQERHHWEVFVLCLSTNTCSEMTEKHRHK